MSVYVHPTATVEDLAVVGEGTKVWHEAQIRTRANVGARCIIGKGAFVGSDATLVAPVTIGDGAYIGAGSCITEDVPAEALALGRARQVVKPGWVKKRNG